MCVCVWSGLCAFVCHYCVPHWPYLFLSSAHQMPISNKLQQFFGVIPGPGHFRVIHTHSHTHTHHLALLYFSFMIKLKLFYSFEAVARCVSGAYNTVSFGCFVLLGLFNDRLCNENVSSIDAEWVCAMAWAYFSFSFFIYCCWCASTKRPSLPSQNKEDE